MNIRELERRLNFYYPQPVPALRRLEENVAIIGASAIITLVILALGIMCL
jgi:hypothetical protein